jgi:large subunit ribosomal protein L21
MSSYAVVETGSKQYRVEPQSVFDVELVAPLENSKEILLENVLLIRDGENLKVGTPFVEGAKVVCEYLGNVRGPKLTIFGFRPKKSSKRKIGHRQHLSRLKVKDIIG